MLGSVGKRITVYCCRGSMGAVGGGLVAYLCVYLSIVRIFTRAERRKEAKRFGVLSFKTAHSAVVIRAGTVGRTVRDYCERKNKEIIVPPNGFGANAVFLGSGMRLRLSGNAYLCTDRSCTSFPVRPETTCHSLGSTNK